MSLPHAAPSDSRSLCLGPVRGASWAAAPNRPGLRPPNSGAPLYPPFQGEKETGNAPQKAGGGTIKGGMRGKGWGSPDLCFHD